MAELIKRPKLSLIGAGAIGGSMAHLASVKELGDVVLFDVVPKMPCGKALDVLHVSSVTGSSSLITGSNDYAAIEDSDVVIVTAGLTKIPGKSDSEWSRDDLLPINAKIMRQVGDAIRIYCPEAFVICITNPLDCMVQVLLEASGCPRSMVCGMAGVLDSARFRSLIATKLKVCPASVQATVIGAHGDAMIPLPRYCTVNGIPLSEFIEDGWLTEAEMAEIVQKTKHGGKEIVNLLGLGSAFYAPATSAIEMAEAFLKDRKKLLPACCFLEGQYGVNDMCLGVPCIIGREGIEKIIQLKLNDQEKKDLEFSIADVKKLCDKLVAMEKAAGEAGEVGVTVRGK